MGALLVTSRNLVGRPGDSRSSTPCGPALVRSGHRYLRPVRAVAATRSAGLRVSEISSPGFHAGRAIGCAPRSAAGQARRPRRVTATTRGSPPCCGRRRARRSPSATTSRSCRTHARSIRACSTTFAPPPSRIHLLYYEWASDPFTEEVGGAARREGQARREVQDPLRSFRQLLDAEQGLCPATRAPRRPACTRSRRSGSLHTHQLSQSSQARGHRRRDRLFGRLEPDREAPDRARGFTGWRDTHARVTGEAVAMLQTVFATMWHNTTGEFLFEDDVLSRRCEDGARVCRSRS